MVRWHLAKPVVVLALAAFIGPAAADEAEKVFKSAYAQRLRRVLGTPAGQDDLMLAEELVEAVGSVPQASLAAVMCRQAYDLASKWPEGAPVALAAMKLMLKRVPAARAEALAGIAAVREAQLRRAKGPQRKLQARELMAALLAAAGAKGDRHDYADAIRLARKALTLARSLKSPTSVEIQRTLKDLAERARIARQVERLEGQLKVNPGNHAVREALIRLYVVQLDDPSRAARLINEDVDEVLRTYVPLAAGDQDKLAGPACLELGRWYAVLAEGAVGRGRELMLARAARYLGLCLGKYRGLDLQSIRCELLLRRIQASLVGLSLAGPGRWTDVQLLICPLRDVSAGKWISGGGQLASVKMERCRITVPVTIEGNYELQVHFVRTSGWGHFGVVLPVGLRRVTLMLGSWRDRLTPIGGTYARRKSAQVHHSRVKTGRQHDCRVRVLVRGNRAEIKVALDDEPYMHWEGPIEDLSPAHPARSKVVGLETRSSRVAVGRIVLRMLSGKAKVHATLANFAHKAGWGGGWVDLLEGLGAVGPPWKRGPLGLGVDADGVAKIALAPGPTGSYEFMTRFSRHKGWGHLAVIFPVGVGRSTVQFGSARGPHAGLYSVNGKPVGENETTVRGRAIHNDRWYTVHVKVVARGAGGDIAVDVNHKRLIRWSGPVSALKGLEMFDPSVLGLAVSRSGVIFSSCRLRAIAPPAAAGRADKLFGELFDGQVKQAAGTQPDKQDDADLAADLLAVAKAYPSEPLLAVRLCEAAYRLGSAAPVGADVAVAAMEYLAERMPGRKTHCLEKILPVRQLQYRAAQRWEKVQAGQRYVDGLLETAEVKVGENDYAGARKLLRAALPVAKAIGSLAKDEIDGRLKRLAAGEPTLREIARLTACLKTTQPGSPEALKAKADLKKIEKKLLAATRPAEASRDGWVDVLRPVNPLKHAVKGTWQRRGAKLGVLPSWDAETLIPAAPRGSYDLRVVFSRTKGQHMVMLHLPVGRRRACFGMDGRGGMMGWFEGGSRRAHGDAQEIGRFKTGQSVTVDAAVRLLGKEASIEIKINGIPKPYMHWRGPRSALGAVRSPNFLRLGANNCSVIFHSVRLRPR